MDLNRVFAALGDAGIRVRSMRTRANRLEELFVRLTGDNKQGGRERAGAARMSSCDDHAPSAPRRRISPPSRPSRAAR